MNKLNIKKSSIALLLAMSTLYGCSGDDPVAEDIPARLTPRDFTSADIVGQSVKGTMSNADVTVQQMNGAPISITSERQTDGTGSVTLKVRGNDGFGIDSMFKITVTADSDTQMMCDAITCAGVDLGEVLSGSPLVGSSLTTLAYVNVPYANSSDGNADATFQASALTTVATQLIENAVAGGKNVSVRALYELALQEFSELTLKAIGVFSPGANVFQTELISAESYQNFVVDQACEDVPLVDDEGNPILDDEGTPALDDEGNPILDDDGEPVLNDDGAQIVEEVCTDILADADLIKLSLANAAFANISEFETFNALFDETAARTIAAMGGDEAALDPIRERLFASIQAIPFLDQLGLVAEQVINLGLPFLEAGSDGGPVQEVTSDANLSGAIITARNRIGDGEAETMAFDGDINTKWLDHNDWSGAPTVEDPSWLQIQFDEVHAVSSLFITSANDGPERDPENFDLLASNDGVTWVKLASFIGESFDERFERKEFGFSNGLEYSYYRLNITKNKGDNTLMQLAEIQLVGPIYPSIDHTDPVGTGTITARNRIGDGEAETFAFDNDPNTKWLDHNDWAGAPTVEDPSWVQIDFPEAVAVNVLGITSADDAPERDPENFTLVGSNDAGVTWTVLADFIGSSFDERLERRLLSVDNVLAYSTYRINITKNKGDNTLMQVAEFELIGPKLPSINHGMADGVIITARNRIGDGEAESFAFDGDSNTKWLDHNDWLGAPTAEDPSWVQVELPAPATVNKLGIVSADDGPERDPENFDLLASNDGVTWITLASYIGESFDDRFERKQFSFGNDLAFSFYRLNITKNKGDNTLMQVAEIELIGPQYSSIDHSSAQDAVISARNHIGDGEVETMAFDDDINTKWLDHNDWLGAPTVEDPSWIQVDFSQERIVTSLAITSANDAPERDPENFTLVGSNDGGVTWEVIKSWIGETFDSRFERKLFEMGNGFAYSTYRLNITKNKGDNTLLQIAEIELIGPENQ